MPPLPPAADRQVVSSGSGTAASAISACASAEVAMETLKNRPDFLRAASARRQGAAGFLLQARRRAPEETGSAVIRVGYTCSKKIGNAVARNRAKRRLRALAREIMPGLAKSGWDYVLVGRPNATVSRDFADLRRDLHEALTRIHAPKKPDSRAADSARGDSAKGNSSQRSSTQSDGAREGSRA
ncbi:ribonuclease P protein component [Paracoccus aminophilus]